MNLRDASQNRSRGKFGAIAFPAVLAFLLLAVPIPFFALLLSVNRYATMGQLAVDCDGPDIVLMFAIPSVTIYGVSAACFGFAALGTRRRLHAVVALTCLAVALCVVPKLLSALAAIRSYAEISMCS